MVWAILSFRRNPGQGKDRSRSPCKDVGQTVLNESQEDALIKKEKEGFQEGGTSIIDRVNSQLGMR